MVQPALKRQDVPHSRPRRPSQLWTFVKMILPIVIIGFFGCLKIMAMAREAELQWEVRRLQRLRLEERFLETQLVRERNELCNHERLSAYAQAHGMVSATERLPMDVGLLPEHKIYWQLPGETAGLQFTRHTEPPPAGLQLAENR